MAGKKRGTDLERAIRDMEEARMRHVAWRHWIRQGNDPVPTRRNTVKQEDLWVRRYDNVLKVLRKMEAARGATP
jgi:hypothetical protein